MNSTASSRAAPGASAAGIAAKSNTLGHERLPEMAQPDVVHRDAASAIVSIRNQRQTQRRPVLVSGIRGYMVLVIGVDRATEIEQCRGTRGLASSRAFWQPSTSRLLVGRPGPGPPAARKGIIEGFKE